MAAIADLSDLVNRMTGGNSGNPENIFWHKTWFFGSGGTADTWTAGMLYDTWRYQGVPGFGEVPTTVEAPDRTTPGAVPITNASGGRDKWLVQAGWVPANVSDAGMLLVYDRLLHISGLSGTVTTAQTVGGSITRNTGGHGNRICATIYTNVGSSIRTLSASYTNQDGTSGRTATYTAFGGTANTPGNEVNELIFLSLQSGDTGVRSVQDVTLNASTGTAGDFGITIIRPLFWLSATSRGGAHRDFTLGPAGIKKIDPDACLAMATMAHSVTEVAQFGVLSTVEA
jgi:hypothetical protein